ncbi:hypothetical protein LSAT2_010715 [Lamellibrachia satsuma]|nr:hypothetical protein LSAT2_010715 [Lamellibrachia satsuma]
MPVPIAHTIRMTRVPRDHATTLRRRHCDSGQLSPVLNSSDRLGVQRVWREETTIVQCARYDRTVQSSEWAFAPAPPDHLDNLTVFLKVITVLVSFRLNLEFSQQEEPKRTTNEADSASGHDANYACRKRLVAAGRDGRTRPRGCGPVRRDNAQPVYLRAPWAQHGTGPVPVASRTHYGAVTS